jgi:hypothetical protein
LGEDNQLRCEDQDGEVSYLSAEAVPPAEVAQESHPGQHLAPLMTLAIAFWPPESITDSSRLLTALDLCSPSSALGLGVYTNADAGKL